MRLVPGSLFGRTALLIAGMLLLYSLIVWQGLVGSVVMPASTLAVEVLKQRATGAIAAHAGTQAFPPDTRFEPTAPPRVPWHYRWSAYANYIETVRAQLQAALHAPVRLYRFAAPAEFWVQLPQVPDAWLVLSWRVAAPTAPLAGMLVLSAGALIVLTGAAFSARRLTAPLATLADAAAQVAEGHTVRLDTERGPQEVRALARAFQSMAQRLAQLDEQRELMLGGISHDLRTPLARIRVAIELLEGQSPALIEEMAASVTEMDRMVGQFLQFVRANYQETPTEAVADEVIRQTLAIYGADERLQLVLNAAAPRAFAVNALRHIVLNLVQNALEYGVAPVVVRSELGPTHLRLSVADQGPGLDALHWDEALRPFQRPHSTTHTGHAGLGLALVDRLVRAAGGTLDARVSSGFIVAVALPLRLM